MLALRRLLRPRHVASLDPVGEQIELVRKRKFPIVGDGAGVWSFIHIDDAATATVAAVERGAPGIYNVVDDEPAPVSRVAAGAGERRRGEAAATVPALARPARRPARRRP